MLGSKAAEREQTILYLVKDMKVFSISYITNSKYLKGQIGVIEAIYDLESYGYLECLEDVNDDRFIMRCFEGLLNKTRFWGRFFGRQSIFDFQWKITEKGRKFILDHQSQRR